MYMRLLRLVCPPLNKHHRKFSSSPTCVSARFVNTLAMRLRTRAQAQNTEGDMEVDQPVKKPVSRRTLDFEALMNKVFQNGPLVPADEASDREVQYNEDIADLVGIQGRDYSSLWHK